MFDTLKAHAYAQKARRISSLFDDPDRAEAFSIQWGEMLFDYSKTNMDETARNLLLEIFNKAGVAAKRTAMFSGEKINETENRAVLHTALRNNAQSEVLVDGSDVMPEVVAVRAAMVRFSTDLRTGAFTGQGGKITDVVNIGIGGSDLALPWPYWHFNPTRMGRTVISCLISTVHMLQMFSNPWIQKQHL